MSETTIPYAGVPSAADPREPENENDANRTKLLVLGGLVGVVVLGVISYFLFFAGGDDTTDTSKAAPKTASAAPALPAPEVVDEQPEQRVAAKSFGRDPFKAPPAVVAMQVAAAAQQAQAPATEVVDSPTSAVTTDAYRFKVVDVAPDNSTVTVKVNGKVYRNLTAGEVFAGVFKVRLVSGQVNTFQFGEEIFNVNGENAITLA